MAESNYLASGTVLSTHLARPGKVNMPKIAENRLARARRNRPLRHWCCTLLVMAATILAVPMTAQKGKPLSVKDVSELLTGGVSSSEIANVVSQNGISFRMFDELEAQFRQQGATDELIDALKRASKPAETPPPPPPSGTLKIHSQPPEAQVYVDDELKGSTDSSGDLRLSGMAPGTYALRVSLAGYKSWENPITVNAGEVENTFVNLEKQNLAPAVTLAADRASIERGQSVYLRWTSLNASDVDIEPGVGKVALSGSTSVSPRESTTYTLTAIGPGGIKTATYYVGVTTPPPPPPAPVYHPPAGNLPGFPIPGASYQEIKFFESGYNAPQLGSRTYATQFSHRTARYINWELHLSCPAIASRVNFTIYSTWYNPNGTVFANDTMNTYAEAGWTFPVYNSGRGWQRTGMWKHGRYRVELSVNGSRIATGYFDIF